MKFIAKGPDIPLDILKALDDDNLVFFCGAGVSYKAGFNGFKWLVASIYKNLGENINLHSLENDAFENGNYDITLGLLENRLPKGRMRESLIKALKLKGKADLSTHNSILDLCKTKSGAYRLVTTNFDRGFIKHNSKKLQIDFAPLLRTPKKSAWKNPVYLHGLIGQDGDYGENLVVTSADFGNAYLLERWASKFITDLFRRFNILFVGYSIKDPVFRYLMDALAADRATGDEKMKAYILDSFNDSDSDIKRSFKYKKAEWEARDIIPILYEAPGNDHENLHSTLRNWAQRHSQGLLGKHNIIKDYITLKPPLNVQESEVQQVLWAINEPSGSAAKVFAESDPIAPIEWIELFDSHGILNADPDEYPENECSLVSYRIYLTHPEINKPTWQIIKWFVRHLNNPKAIDWIIKKGGIIHPRFADMIRRALDDGELSSEPVKEKVWRILISPLNCGISDFQRSFIGFKNLADNRMRLLSKIEIQEYLNPFFTFQVPYRYDDIDTDIEDQSISNYLNADIKIGRQYAASQLKKQLLDEKHSDLLIDLIETLSTIQNRIMDMQALIEKADEKYDSTYIHHPSITPHRQNHNFDDWTHIVDLIYQGFERLCQKKT